MKMKKTLAISMALSLSVMCVPFSGVSPELSGITLNADAVSFSAPEVSSQKNNVEDTVDEALDDFFDSIDVMLDGDLPTASGKYGDCKYKFDRLDKTITFSGDGECPGIGSREQLDELTANNKFPIYYVNYEDGITSISNCEYEDLNPYSHV